MVSFIKPLKMSKVSVANFVIQHITHFTDLITLFSQFNFATTHIMSSNRTLIYDSSLLFTLGLALKMITP